MYKKSILAILFVMPAFLVRAQSLRPDTAGRHILESIAMDESLDDNLLNDFDLFLDSMLAPRSYVLVSFSGGQGYFNFTNKNNTTTKALKKFIWSPTLGYYDKSGFGVIGTSYMVRDSSRRYWYQSSITCSYDYIRDRHLATGIAYTRYFTKNYLPFYTTPIQNELSTYFLWRKSWIQPGITANYGWGSHTEFTKREVIYRKLVAAVLAHRNIPVLDTVTIIRKNRESIVDFSFAASIRHDFYWLNIFSKKDHIRLSPMVSLTGGTQKFGFNQSTGAIGPVRATVLNTQSISLQQKFQLLSTTLYLRAEYVIGKFFVEPQLLFDYYFPGSDDHFTTSISFATGYMF